YEWLKSYIDTAVASSQVNAFLDQLLNAYLTQGTIDVMKGFNTAQVSNVLAQIPLTLTISCALPVVSGYRQTTSPTAALYGTANAIDTRAIVVAGVTSSWTAWRGTWTNNSVALSPGINRITVQALGTNGNEIAR